MRVTWSLTRGLIEVLLWNSTHVVTMQAWGWGKRLIPSVEAEESVWGRGESDNPMMLLPQQTSLHSGS